MAADLLDRICSKVTVSNYFNDFRVLLTNHMLANPIQLGGPGIEVKVDESFFSGKRKYNRGRLVQGVAQPWVLGLLDTATANVVMLCLQDRTAQTLIPYIEQFVAPRSTIVTDGWAAYTQIANSPNNYIHQVVNHTENFVDPVTLAHTQEIEGFWAHAKAKYKDCRGFHPNVRANYLDEIQWRWNTRQDPPLLKMMEVIRELYNPNAFQNALPPQVLARKPACVYP